MNIKCEQAWEAFKNDVEIPSKRALVLDLIMAAGLDFYDKWDQAYIHKGQTTLASDRDFALAKISIDQLPFFSTQCGSIPNKPFKPKVLELLKIHRVNYVVAIIDQHEPEIISLIAPLKRKAGVRLEDLVCKNNGSLRWDSSQVDGWSVFESE